MSAKWGTRRGFIKLHVGVDAKTKKIYAVAITDNKHGDSPLVNPVRTSSWPPCGNN